MPIALFLGFLGFRFGLRGVYFVIMTIAFAELARLAVSHIEALGSFTGIFLDFNPSFYNFQFRGNMPYYYIALGFMVASLIAVRIIEVSKVGRFIVAIREDEEAAQALGVNTFKYNMIAIAISAFMTSLAGAFYANYIFYLHPNSLFGMSLSIELILRPIVGGAWDPLRAGDRLHYSDPAVGNIPGLFRKGRSGGTAPHSLRRTDDSGGSFHAQRNRCLCKKIVKSDSQTKLGGAA